MRARRRGVKPRAFARARAARSLRMTAPRLYGLRIESQWRRRRGEPGLRQVLPCGVLLFDQPHLACANPTLELLFAGDGVANIAKLLEVDQPADPVPARKAGREAALVLLHAPHEVVGDARV